MSIDLKIEDGTLATSTANTFIDADNFETYAEARGELSYVTSYTGDEIEEALIRSADYLNSLNWKGKKRTYDQPMCFPRNYLRDRDGLAIDYDIVPVKVKLAQYEATKAELVSPGALQPDLSRGGQIRRKTIGPITTEYFQGANASTVRTKIRGFLKDYTIGTINVPIERS